MRLPIRAVSLGYNCRRAYCQRISRLVTNTSTLTILFTDVVGSTSMRTGRGDEAGAPPAPGSQRARPPRNRVPGGRISFPRRQRLHLRAAEAIERVYAQELDEHVADLAYHLSQGGAHERAADYLTKAGEEAAQRYASAEALAYYRYGRLAARLHTIADSYSAVDHPRFPLDLEHLLDAPMASIEPFLGSQPEHWRYLAELAQQLKASLASMPLSELEWGICHGDLHTGNLHEAAGDFTLFDFDCGGPGWRAYDLAVFRWAATRRAKRPWTWFLQGYRSMRSLSPLDAQAVPIFVVIRQIWWLGLQTANAHDWGGDGRLAPAFFDQQVSYLRKLQSVLADLPPELRKQ